MEHKIFIRKCFMVLYWVCIFQANTGLAQDGKGSEKEFQKARQKMVQELISTRDITKPAVIKAMRTVPRHLFVPEAHKSQAYENHPLPIGQGQTISQPAVVAYMTELANISSNDRVLEIGTGSGYQAAILGELAKEVYSIEIIPEMAEKSAQLLKELGYTNIFVKQGNGYLGWPEHAPFDAIIVTAAPPEIPETLVEQLAIGGRMVVPVGTTHQQLVIITKTQKGVSEKKTVPVKFVPMVEKPREQ